MVWQSDIASPLCAIALSTFPARSPCQNGDGVECLLSDTSEKIGVWKPNGKLPFQRKPSECLVPDKLETEIHNNLDLVPSPTAEHPGLTL